MPKIFYIDAVLTSHRTTMRVVRQTIQNNQPYRGALVRAFLYHGAVSHQLKPVRVLPNGEPDFAVHFPDRATIHTVNTTHAQNARHQFTFYFTTTRRHDANRPIALRSFWGTVLVVRRATPIRYSARTARFQSHWVRNARETPAEKRAIESLLGRSHDQSSFAGL